MWRLRTEFLPLRQSTLRFLMWGLGHPSISPTEELHGRVAATEGRFLSSQGRRGDPLTGVSLPLRNRQTVALTGRYCTVDLPFAIVEPYPAPLGGDARGDRCVSTSTTLHRYTLTLHDWSTVQHTGSA